jgi:hypothetical protein
MTRETLSERTGLLVLGMHRSGTSAFARVLNLLGAGLPTRVVGANSSNERGHWEPKAVVETNDVLLSELGSRWADWRRLPLDSICHSRSGQMITEIKRAIEEEFCQEKLFVLKDPRICRFVPFYLRAMCDLGIEPRSILVFRNPLAVAASLGARNGMTEFRRLGLVAPRARGGGKYKGPNSHVRQL